MENIIKTTIEVNNMEIRVLRIEENEYVSSDRFSKIC